MQGNNRSSSAPRLPFPLPDQYVTTLNIESDAAYFRVLYPFLPDYIGLRNPYSGEIIRSSEDYERYLREHCYYNRCGHDAHAVRIRLNDALDENLRLTTTAQKAEHTAAQNRKLLAEKDQLQEKNKSLISQVNDLLSDLSSKKLSLRVFVALFSIVSVVCVLLALFAFASLPTGTYIGNTGTKVLHDPSCSFLPNADYRVEYNSLFRAKLAGYSLCTACFHNGSPKDSAARSSTPTVHATTVSPKSFVPTANSSSSYSFVQYVANTSSKKVHTPFCSFLPDEKNRVYYNDLDEALEDGYEPCKKCHPH